MNNYKITMENIRPQDKLALIGDGTFDSKVSFTIIADKIKAYNDDGTETDFVLSGESVIDTTITDGNDYEETFRCRGMIYAVGYLWCSMRTAGADQPNQPYEMPQILKINPYNLDDYEILYYHSEYETHSSSSIEQLIYANGYIWFPRSHREQKLVKLNPLISLSNPSCYEFIDFSSIGISTINTTLITNNDNSLFMGTTGGITSHIPLTCSNVVLDANNRDISFTIENHIIDFDLKTMIIRGLTIDEYPLYAGQALSISSITISGRDTLITGTILWVNDADVFTLTSLYAGYSGSVVIKFDISDVNDVVVEKVFYIGTSTSLHASMQYGDNVVFTSQSSSCNGQLAVKIDEFDNCSFGIIPSFNLRLIGIGGGNSVWFGANRAITDDICVIGDYGYFGNESEPNNTSTIYKFNLITMKNEDAVVVSDVNACLGTFAYNNQIYALFDASPGMIAILDTNLNIIQEIILPDGYESCNEFVVTEDSIYIAFWANRPLRIIRIPNLDESGFIANPQITIGGDNNIVAFDVIDSNQDTVHFSMLERDGLLFTSDNGENTFTVNNEGMINTIKYNYPEEDFPYHILKNTTKYDPFSYISYDYMVSSSRKASFEAYIEDYFDTETFDFINSLTRVGYGSYDNDITLYNHFYYSTEDDEDEFVRIELEDNTMVYDVGGTIKDKYGEDRTVSSREVISEGISTIMCRIYQITDNGERIVYSGLIDKRETRFDGKKLKIGLIDMMGLYVELAEKYNIVVGDINNSGVDSISSLSKISSFILFLRNNLNINNLFIPDPNDIRINTENVKIEESLYYQSVDNVYGYAMSYVYWSSPYFGIDGGFAFNSYIPIIVNKDDNDNITLSIHDMSGAYHNESFSFGSSLFDESSALMINMSNIKVYYPKKYDFFGIDNYHMDNTIDDTISVRSETLNSRRSKYCAFANLKITYFEKFINATNRITTVCIYPNIGIFTDNEYNSYYNTLLAKFNNNKIAKIEIDYTYNDFVQDTGDTFIYEYVKYLIENNDELSSAINDEIIAFETELNSILNNYVLSFIVAETPTTLDLSIPNNPLLSNFITINDNPDGNDYKYLVKIESQKRTIINPLFYEYDGDTMAYYDDTILFTDTYIDTLPLYSGEYSLYDITKLFSLTCYNKILTKDTGEMYFDKESYSNTNGYVDIDKAEIINSYSQESMIGDDEEFNILDNIYIGTKYIKEAYKRLETSTKETYKKLYENNNMKIGFNLANYNYDIKNVNGTIIANRELQHKDVLRIYDGSRQIIHVFLTSVKFINNDTELELEGITQKTRKITLYSADEYKTISR